MKFTNEVDDVVHREDGVGEQLHHYGERLRHLPGGGRGREELRLICRLVGRVTSGPDTSNGQDNLAETR